MGSPAGFASTALQSSSPSVVAPGMGGPGAPGMGGPGAGSPGPAEPPEELKMYKQSLL